MASGFGRCTNHKRHGAGLAPSAWKTHPNCWDPWSCSHDPMAISGGGSGRTIASKPARNQGKKCQPGSLLATTGNQRYRAGKSGIQMHFLIAVTGAPHKNNGFWSG